MFSSLNFNYNQFNKLFPFFLLINEKCEIISAGKSFFKITDLTIGYKFQTIFEIKRPHTEINSFNDLLKMKDQLVFFECKHDANLIFRGQFEHLEDSILFIGSPWFYSMDQVSQKKLTLTDFALHDPMMDLLHVLKTAEMASDDLKQLVKTIDKQKKELKEASKQVAEIALFPQQNPDPLIRINLEGEVLLRNPAAEHIHELTYHDIKYNSLDVWKTILKDIDPAKVKNIVETRFEDKIYSFLIVKLEGYNYFNIYGRDISDQKIYEEELRKLSLVADKTTNAVIITDAEGKIEWANAAFEWATGYELKEVIGLKPGHFLQGKDTDIENVKLIRKKLKTGENFSQEILNYTKKGKPYWIKMNFHSIKNDKGEIEKIFSIQDDITIQKRTQEILARREEKYRSIISNVNLGLLEKDLEGRILMANQSFCDMSGFTQQELYGQKANELFFKNEIQPDIKLIDNQQSFQISNAEEIEVEIKDKVKKHWLVSEALMYNDNGEQIGYIGIHLDITDRKDQERKLENLLKSLQTVNQELNDFAYIVSHDLKAPLRAIGSLATWLENDYSQKLDNEGKETLKLLVQRTQRMHNLIEGVLNYSRVGRIAENIKLINTNALVEKVIDLISPPKHIKIELQNTLHSIHFDEVKLQQIFQNLISNAIKFNDKANGLIKISSIIKSDEIIFAIEDNGPGIEESYYDKIFQIFQTLNARDSFESTGVGLTIVKKIIENFGGKIWVSSEPTKKTTFYFTVINQK